MIARRVTSILTRTYEIRRGLRARLAALTLLAASPACNDPDLDRDPEAWIGSGETQWQPLSDGDDVDIVFGLQGGQHIWGAVRVVGVNWREAEITFRLLDLAGSELSAASVFAEKMRECAPVDGESCEDGVGETVGLPILVDDVEAVIWEDVTVELKVLDGEGRRADASVWVVPRYGGT